MTFIDYSHDKYSNVASTLVYYQIGHAKPASEKYVCLEVMS